MSSRIIPTKKVVVDIFDNINFTCKVYNYDGTFIEILSLLKADFSEDGDLFQIDNLFLTYPDFGVVTVNDVTHNYTYTNSIVVDEEFFPDTYVMFLDDYYSYLKAFHTSLTFVDLTNIETQLSNILSIISLLPSPDSLQTLFGAIPNRLEFQQFFSDINIDTSNLLTKNDINNIVLPSLNGNGSEYKDGTQVKVSGRDVVYTVERSYHSLYSDNGYTVHYDLVSSDGYRCTVPEALLTKYTSGV